MNRVHEGNIHPSSLISHLQVSPFILFLTASDRQCRLASIVQRQDYGYQTKKYALSGIVAGTAIKGYGLPPYAIIDSVINIVRE